MATTTNYSWTTPDNTAYVKDGASAIRTLGSSVDTTLYTALGGTYPGLRLVKKQTIGTAVSSVTVTSAFSATYQAYQIVITGGVGSADQNVGLRLGSSTSAYYEVLRYANYQGVSQVNANSDNGSRWTYTGYATGNVISFDVKLRNPFLSTLTLMESSYINQSASGTNNGIHQSGASFTDFTIVSSNGSLTGGTIYVYGYGAS